MTTHCTDNPLTLWEIESDRSPRETTPRALVMSILNVTPDSFFVGSRVQGEGELRGRIESMVAEGADIIDIGGYSTRPGADEVPTDEEVRRVMEGVRVAREVAPELTLSIDTFRSEVAEAVLSEYDNVIINDITAGEGDERMAAVVAKYDAPMVIMHSRGTPKTMQSLTDYDNVVGEVRDYLLARAEALREQGVRRLILDPGVGFAKTVEQNYALLRELTTLTSLPYPVLMGISRKSFIYKPLGVGPEDVLEATTALHWACLERGAAILRVHDTKVAREIVTLYETFSRL